MNETLDTRVTFGLDIRPASVDLWPPIVDLFGGRGEPDVNQVRNCPVPPSPTDISLRSECIP